MTHSQLEKMDYNADGETLEMYYNTEDGTFEIQNRENEKLVDECGNF